MAVDSNRPARNRPFLLKDPQWEPRRRLRRRVALGAVAVALTIGTAVVSGQAVADRLRVERGYRQAMADDLERFAAVQTEFRAAHGRWSTLEELERRFVPSQGIRILLRADGGGWVATAIHVRTDKSCVMRAPTSAGATPPTC